MTAYKITGQGAAPFHSDLTAPSPSPNRELLDLYYYERDREAKRELESRGFDTAWLDYCREVRVDGRIPSPKRYKDEMKRKKSVTGGS